MNPIYRDILGTIDIDRLLNQTETLLDIELGQTFAHYKQSAQYVCDALRQVGVPHVEYLTFPADGKTVYYDNRMPLAWDATIGRLTLLTPLPGSSDAPGLAPVSKTGEQVIADYQQHPFHLIKGSTSTPAGGQLTRIITEAQYLAGEDPRGAMVMLNPLTPPRSKVLVPLLDQGALGIVTDFLKGRYASPDSIQWVTACTEGANWHVQCDDRPFIGFSVSPRVGDMIRNAATTGGLKARVECDGRRYEGELPAVTGLIPGKRKEEVWIVAHLYEPLIDDDSAGVATALEAARQFLMRGTPEFSVRFVFAMEFYGFAAYAASRGTRLREEVVGACNFDGLKAVPRVRIRCVPAGVGTPFFGNAVLEWLVNDLQKDTDAFVLEMGTPAYYDDIFLSDPTIGIPTVWPLGNNGGFWHNSIQTKGFLDKDTYTKVAAFDISIVYSLANPNEAMFDSAVGFAREHLLGTSRSIATKPFGSDAERLAHRLRRESERIADFGRFLPCEKIDRAIAALKREHSGLAATLTDARPASPWRDYAAGIVMARQGQGFPYDLARVPKNERRALPDTMIYGTFANVLANMDGRKDLATVIREAEYENDRPETEARIKAFVVAANYLADYGYLKAVKRPALTDSDIAEALRTLGVHEGDLLFVHAAMSACGYIQGGATALIDGLFRSIGSGGTVLCAAFTSPYVHFGASVNKSYVYRPYDAGDLSQIWTGAVPRTLLKRYPDARRSRHITHSWAGRGPLADECTREHEPFAAPGAANGPMGKGLARGGRILYFGTGLTTSTFLHFLEAQSHASYLEPAVCRIKTPEGSLRTVLIPEQFAGHRSFYGPDVENSKFFSRAVKAGLNIRRLKLGPGTLHLIDMRELFDIGMNLLKEDPMVLLCDKPDCSFCQRAQSEARTVRSSDRQ